VDGGVVSAIELFPAIDLRGGSVVRLLHGDYGAETRYGDDPIAVAEGFAEEGATWIHVVDLDAARGDGPVNRSVVGAIVERLSSSGVRVQTGGGVRTLDDARELAALGVSRVVMGSAAVRQPELVDSASSLVPVAVGLDHRAGRLATDGWTVDSDTSVEVALGSFPSAEAFIITDISRDGALSGPDLTGLAGAVQASGRPVIASGGVANLADLQALAAIPGLAGAIVGRAIYEGRFTVSEAVAALGSAS